MAPAKHISETIESVARELAEAEASLLEATEAHDLALSAAAADLALGVVSIGDAAARTGASEETLARATTLVDRLSRALPTLRDRLAVQEGEERKRAADASAKELAAACGKANQAATKLAALLGDLDAAAAGLSALRVAADRAADKAAGASLEEPLDPLLSESARPSARRSASRTVQPPPGWQDEPGWPSIDSLRQVLDLGPRRPLADLEEAGRLKSEEVGKQHAEILAWVAVRPYARLPLVLADATLPDSVKREAEQILADAIAAREQAAGWSSDPDPVEAEPEPSEPVAAAQAAPRSS